MKGISRCPCQTQGNTPFKRRVDFQENKLLDEKQPTGGAQNADRDYSNVPRYLSY